MNRITMVAGAEMNGLREYEINMEQLEMVAGGAEEEPDELIEGIIIAALTFAAKTIIKLILPETFDEFWNWVRNNHIKTVAMIAVASKIAAAAYAAMSWEKRRRFMEIVWKAL